MLNVAEGQKKNRVKRSFQWKYARINVRSLRTSDIFVFCAGKEMNRWTENAEDQKWGRKINIYIYTRKINKNRKKYFWENVKHRVLFPRKT